jgi:hypothetical protein
MSSKRFLIIVLLAYILILGAIILDILNGNSILASLTSFVFGGCISLNIPTYRMIRSREKIKSEIP